MKANIDIQYTKAMHLRFAISRLPEDSPLAGHPLSYVSQEDLIVTLRQIANALESKDVTLTSFDK